ncbi:hypothetical protein FQN54_006548 [Arachnomyces sp. PD_36]|nr:hypothetical protein FQN54_006548 [Arachnomyces sp. PD_36]
MSSPSVQSPFIPLQIPRRSPRQQMRQRNIAPKKVYGKRKTNVPRAVFAEEINGANIPKGERDEVTRLTKEVEKKLTVVDTSKPEAKEGRVSQRKCEDKHVEEGEKPMAEPPATERKEMDEVVGKLVEIRISNRKPEGYSSGSEISIESPPKVKAKPEKPKNKRASRVSTGCIQDMKTNTYVRPILDEVMSATRSVQKFNSWATYAGDKFDVEKIAEGSYGEVYQLHLREEAIPKGSISKSRLARLRAYGDGVFKIVPIRAQSGVGSKKFTTVGEIVAEVQMLKLLDEVPGFARFREVHVVQGRFPPKYQAAWWKYRDTKDDCLNPDPAKKASYPDTQLWAILEMNNAGCELEKFPWSSTFQIYDIFWGVAMALARAEELAGFEHRDLHLGNVCVRSIRPDGHMHRPVNFTEEDLKQTTGFGLSGLETTLIDYSLSRAELISAENPEWTNIAASDLDKKKIFDAVGRDEDEKLLRNTYRYMRAQLYKGDPLDPDQSPTIPGQWELYSPRTNLIWLLFLLKTLLKNRKPENSHHAVRQPLTDRTANKIVENQESGKRKDPSVKECKVQAPAVADLQNKLLDRLHVVRNLLNLEGMEESMCCAGDLVAFAIDSQWLEENDFLCEGD